MKNKKLLTEEINKMFHLINYKLGVPRLNEDNKASFAGKWNEVPEVNKKVLDKSTETNVGLVFAGEEYNYAIGEKNGKYLLYRFRQAEYPEYKGSYGTIEKAKEEGEALESYNPRPSTSSGYHKDDDNGFEWIRDF